MDVSNRIVAVIKAFNLLPHAQRAISFVNCLPHCFWLISHQGFAFTLLLIAFSLVPAEMALAERGVLPRCRIFVPLREPVEALLP